MSVLPVKHTLSQDELVSFGSADGARRGRISRLDVTANRAKVEFRLGKIFTL